MGMYPHTGMRGSRDYAGPAGNLEKLTWLPELGKVARFGSSRTRGLSATDGQPTPISDLLR